jgi:hypothetical protein
MSSFTPSCCTSLLTLFISLTVLYQIIWHNSICIDWFFYIRLEAFLWSPTKLHTKVLKFDYHKLDLFLTVHHQCRYSNIEKPTRCNSNNLLISKISSPCFGQSFAHLQERKTDFYSIWYSPVVVVGRGPESGYVALCVWYEGDCLTSLV